MFTDRSIWTMVHGIGLSGAALMALAAALFSLYAWRTDSEPVAGHTSRALSRLIVFACVTLWLSVLIGTYVIFPPYRAAPPEGALDLSHYPRSMIMASPKTTWLHSFAMEVKEHVPWIAAMLATAVAFVGVRYPSRLLSDAKIRRPAMLLLTICFALVSAVALLGIFVNKVAPLE